MSRFLRVLPCLALMLILIGGGFLRFTNLGAQSYWMDEGYTVNAVTSQMRNGTRGLASVLDSGQTYFCPTYCYPTEAIVRIFGDHPAAYRDFAAVSGVLFILIIYFVSQTLFQNKYVSLLASFFIAFSYWQIAWSRQARWYTLFEVFFWLAIGTFYRFLKADTNRKKAGYLVATVLCSVLAIATQGIAYLLPVVLLAWHVYDKRPNVKHLLISGGIALAFLLFAEFGLGLSFLVPTLRSLHFKNNAFYYGSFVLRTYWPVLILTAYALIRSDKDQKKRLYLILLPLLAYFLSLSLLTDTIEYRYLFHTTPALFLGAAWACVDIWTRITQAYAKTLAFALIVGTFFLSGVGMIVPKPFYTLEADNPDTLERPYFAYTPQPNFTSAYAYIRARLRPGETVIASHPHFTKIFLGQPGLWLGYDYLGRATGERPPLPETEGYAGARTIRSLDELKAAMSAGRGYIVFDYMSIDGRIDKALTDYIELNAERVFYDKTNSYSQIWIYRF